LKIRISSFAITVYTETRAIANPNTIQSHIRDVAEDPNLGTYSDRGHQGFLLLIDIFHIIDRQVVKEREKERDRERESERESV